MGKVSLEGGMGQCRRGSVSEGGEGEISITAHLGNDIVILNKKKLFGKRSISLCFNNKYLFFHA